MPLRFLSAARGAHNTLSSLRVKHLFLLSLPVQRLPCEVRLSVVPCQWWRIIGIPKQIEIK
ncbi:hypothetical protein DMI62_10685 [Escherichia coli]|nr:hypothetical protein [Escherichia coli]